MKKTISLCLILLNVGIIKGQTNIPQAGTITKPVIKIEYDAAGNRIQRRLDYVVIVIGTPIDPVSHGITAANQDPTPAAIVMQNAPEQPQAMANHIDISPEILAISVAETEAINENAINAKMANPADTPAESINNKIKQVIKYSISPNPTHDFVNIDIDPAILQYPDAKAVLYNALGQVMYSQPLVLSNITIQLDNATAGNYTIVIYYGTEIISSQLVVY